MPRGKNALASLKNYFLLHAVQNYIPNGSFFFKQLINTGYMEAYQLTSAFLRSRNNRSELDNSLRKSAREIVQNIVDKIGDEIQKEFDKRGEKITQEFLNHLKQNIQIAIGGKFENFMLSLGDFFVMRVATMRSADPNVIFGNIVSFEKDYKNFDVNTDKLAEAFDSLISSLSDGTIDWVKVVKDNFIIKELRPPKVMQTVQGEMERELEI
jgi:hypothetical protein